MARSRSRFFHHLVFLFSPTSLLNRFILFSLRPPPLSPLYLFSLFLSLSFSLFISLPHIIWLNEYNHSNLNVIANNTISVIVYEIMAFEFSIFCSFKYCIFKWKVKTMNKIVGDYTLDAKLN